MNSSERISELELAIDEIAELIQQLPPGVDYEADAGDTSPEDATAHIGGLIWKICERVSQ